MKKLILFLLASFFYLNTFAQDFYKVTQSAIYKHLDGKWTEVETFEPDNLFLIIDKHKIKITNVNQSAYQTYGDVKKDEYGTHTTYAWSAYDKNGKSCDFVMKYIKKDNMIQMSFLYVDEVIPISYVYYVKPKE